MDMFGFHYPDAHAFHAAGVYIPCVFNRHLCVGGMKAAHVFVVESLFASDKDLPQRPVMLRFRAGGHSAAFVVGNIAVIKFSDHG